MTSATKRSTLVSHLAVYLVLVVAVRDVGISAREVTWPGRAVGGAKPAARRCSPASFRPAAG